MGDEEIAIFPARCQPPHMGHVMTLLREIPKYKKIYVHISDYTFEGKKPMLIPVKEVMRRLKTIFRYFPKIEIICGKGFLERTRFDDLPKFDVVITGDQAVLRRMKLYNIKGRFIRRTRGYSGAIYRRGLKR